MNLACTILTAILLTLTSVPSKEGTPIKGKRFEGAIFPSNFDLLDVFKNVAYPSHFRPNQQMIHELEDQSRIEIKDLNKGKPSQGKGLGPVIHKNLKKYF